MPLKLRDVQKQAFQMTSDAVQASLNNSNVVENPEGLLESDDPRHAYNMPAPDTHGVKVSPREELRRMKPASGRAHVNKTPPSLPITSMKKNLELRQQKAPVQQISSELPYEHEDDQRNGANGAAVNESQLSNLASSRGFSSQKKKPLEPLSKKRVQH